MQDLIKNMHSKRFLLIYLAVVAFLLLFYMSQQQTTVTGVDLSVSAQGPYSLQTPQSLPNFLLRDAEQRLFTNADLQGRWHFVYFFDGGCLPECQAIWQVLGNLAGRYAGDQLAFWIIDVTADLQLVNAPPALPDNVKIIYDPAGERPLWRFFNDALGSNSLFTNLLLIDPSGQWQAGFRAPFTSELLQRFYQQHREHFARGN